MAFCDLRQREVLGACLVLATSICEYGQQAQSHALELPAAGSSRLELKTATKLTR